VRGVRPHVCHRLGVIGLLRMPVAPCRDVPSAGVERTPLARRAWRQEARDGLTVFGHQAMPVAPIERALLTRQTSARSLVPAELSPRNPLRGTDGGGNALKDRDGLGLERLPGASQESTQPHEWIREPAEPTGRTPAAEQLGPRPRPAQEGPRRCGGGSSARPMAVKSSALQPYTARSVSPVGGLVLQEGGGSPPLTLEDEPHGCL
jgi:hypothetical protein